MIVDQMRRAGRRFPSSRRSRSGSDALYDDPDSTIIGNVRRSLTLWYVGVLSIALIVFGAALYVSEERVLVAPIHDDLVARAETIATAWRLDHKHPCPRAGLETLYWVCFSPNGVLLKAGHEASDTPHFITRSLALAALRAGSASDTVDIGGDVGTVHRYAFSVRERAPRSILGVVEVGVRTQGELNALHSLLILLLIFGAIALAGGTLGGLFLANRALVPVRLSVNRQRAFIADASHELRTPLTLARADADLLAPERDRMTAQGAMLLDDLVAELAYMGALAGKLLTLTSLDSGTLRLDHDVVDLADVVSAVVNRSMAYASVHTVTLTGESERRMLVIGDRVLLEQAALVLVENAIKYNRPNGSVHVVVERMNTFACLEVRDTGPGIPSDHLPRLEERFYRVDKSRSRKGGGAGLGLSIARGIMHLHGGMLRIDSTVGKGTTATLLIPMAESHAGADSTPD